MCEVDLKEVIHSLEESLKPYAQMNQKHFTVHMPTQLPAEFSKKTELS